MNVKRIDALLERLKSSRDDRARVIFADGGTAEVGLTEAICLFQGNRPITHVELLGDIQGQGHLPELLEQLTEK